MAGTFRFDGREFDYFVHPYNRARENMRAVEIPIVRDALKQARGAKILEVGNVLSHYGPIDWDVLDVAEIGLGVINADLMTWQPLERWDLIVSISTLEHIGHGKYAQITGSVAPADVVSRMLSWLTIDGRALLTVPVGYNPLLDSALREGVMPIERVCCMRRTLVGNEWVECGLAEAMAAQRPEGYAWAVGMVVMYCTGGGDGEVEPGVR